jgi:uncharacterized protein with LGFP repeats
VNEDVNKGLAEDAERAARGEEPLIPKFRQVPREVQVPAGRESKGMSPEQLNSPVRKLTPEERAAWGKSVEDDVNPALDKFNQGAARSAAKRAGLAKAETTDIPRGGSPVADMPGPRNETPAQAETKTRDFSKLQQDSANSPPANPPEPKPEAPAPAPGNNRRARWQAAQAAHDVPEDAHHQYKGAIEKARQDAGGPGGACEAAKESLMKNPDVTGATHKTEWVGRGPNRFQHEIVITKEGYVLDPVAKQAVDRGLTTWDKLEARGLKNAVEKGIFTPEQWIRFKTLG